MLAFGRYAKNNPYLNEGSDFPPTGSKLALCESDQIQNAPNLGLAKFSAINYCGEIMWSKNTYQFPLTNELPALESLLSGNLLFFYPSVAIIGSRNSIGTELAL